jgi:chromate reductase, NAD(P)H dehydrogenase (quinone)
MVAIIGISGSTRRGSFNSSLLRALAAATPQGVELRMESIAAIPLYNGDDEATGGIPEPVAKLKDAIAGAQGLLLVTPEYNNSMPGVAKNAIDRCSRRTRGCPFRTLGTNLYSGKLLVSRAGNVFDANGNITDAAMKDSVAKFMAGFAAFIR